MSRSICRREVTLSCISCPSLGYSFVQMEPAWERVPVTGTRRHQFHDAHLHTSWQIDRAADMITYVGRETIELFDDEETCLSIAFARPRVIFPFPPPDMLAGEGASTSRGPRFIRTRAVPRGRARGLHSAPLLRPRGGRCYVPRPTERRVAGMEVDLGTRTVALEETETDPSVSVTDEHPSWFRG